jgi:hypothetical protein
MNMNDYKRWLDDRIAAVGQELEILLNGKRALEMAEKAIPDVPPMFQLEKLPVRDKPVKQARNPVLEEIRKRHPNASMRDGTASRQIREWILTFLADGRPVDVHTIVDNVYPGPRTKRETDRIYGQLYELKRVGKIRHNPDEHTYEITSEVKEGER